MRGARQPAALTARDAPAARRNEPSRDLRTRAGEPSDGWNDDGGDANLEVQDSRETAFSAIRRPPVARGEAETRCTGNCSRADPLVVSVAEAAEALGVSDDLVYELTERGDLPCLRFGRRKVIPWRAIELLVEAAVIDFGKSVE